MDRCLDRQIWRIVLDSVQRADRAVKNSGRRPRYPNQLIVAMYFWSVWHDRCLSWACYKTHYNTLFRPRGQLPSISQFTRRIKTDQCQNIIQLVHDDLAARGQPGLLDYLDGKALLVSPVSKDPDAHRGHISGGFAKGYKLHVCVGENRRISVWSITPLNVDEKTVAREMLMHLRPPLDQRLSLTLADSNYDSAPLYNHFGNHGRILLTPLRGRHRVRPGGQPEKKLRRMGPYRRQAVHLWKHRPHMSRFVFKQRNNIEGTFSVLAVALGLDHLPGFVRRLGRVRMWTGTKIIFYHARLLAQERANEKSAA